MSKKLNGISNTIVFIDNIYMSGKTFTEMCDILSTVLLKLKESEFKLKPNKCKFFKRNLEVFGYNIDK